MAFDHPMSLSQPAARPSPADQLRRSRVDSPDSFTTIRCRKCISTFVQTRASTSGLSSPTESVAPHLLAKTLRPILPWVLFPSKIPFFRWTPGVPGHTAKVRWLDSLGASAALLSPRQVLDSVGLAIRRVLIPPFVHRFAADTSLAEAPSPPVSACASPSPRPESQSTGFSLAFTGMSPAGSLSEWGVAVSPALEASFEGRQGRAFTGLSPLASERFRPALRGATPLTFMGFLTFKERSEPEPKGPLSVGTGVPIATTPLCSPRANLGTR